MTRSAFDAGEVWRLKTEKSGRHAMEDYYIDLLGIAPIFAVDKASLLAPVK